MHSFIYKSFTTVCVVLLLGSACAREEASQATAQGALDAGPTQDQDAGPESAENTSRPATSRSDAGTRSSSADAAAPETSEERAAGGSGGGGESRPARASSSQAGSGGTNARATGPKAGAGGQPAAGAPARAGAGGTTTSSTSEAGGGAEAGSRAEGSAGAGGESESNETAGRGGAGGEPSDRELSECEHIASACAAVTEPNDDVTACLAVGESDDASMCRARLEDCRQSCGAPLCEQVLVDCPASEEEGPVQGCHQIGVTNNAGDCFGDGVQCLEFCHMVVTP